MTGGGEEGREKQEKVKLKGEHLTSHTHKRTQKYFGWEKNWQKRKPKVSLWFILEPCLVSKVCINVLHVCMTLSCNFNFTLIFSCSHFLCVTFPSLPVQFFLSLSPSTGDGFHLLCLLLFVSLIKCVLSTFLLSVRHSL